MKKVYSKEELLAIRAMRKSGVSYPVIAKILNTSIRSIQVKASRMKFTNTTKHKTLNSNKDLSQYMKLDSKVKGTIAEYKVALKLLDLGIKVYFPLANNQEEDIIICKTKKYYRVQIKSASKTNDDRFRASIVRKRSVGKNKGSRVRYADIDFFIIFIPILEIFYVIPENKTRKVKELNFYPHKIKTMIRQDIFDWDYYQNAFDLIR
jgi:hypothetical protein